MDLADFDLLSIGWSIEIGIDNFDIGDLDLILPTQKIDWYFGLMEKVIIKDTLFTIYRKRIC